MSCAATTLTGRASQQALRSAARRARGGIGHEAATWFNTNFDIKAAKASSDSERWRVSSERKRFLQVHSAIVACLAESREVANICYERRMK